MHRSKKKRKLTIFLVFWGMLKYTHYSIQKTGHHIVRYKMKTQPKCSLNTLFAPKSVNWDLTIVFFGPLKKVFIAAPLVKFKVIIARMFITIHYF